MKYLFLIALSFVFVNNSYAAQKTKKKSNEKSNAIAIEETEYKTGDIRYGERRGLVEYAQLTGVRSQTRVILYFDNFGEIELKEVFVQSAQSEKRVLRHSFVLYKEGVEYSWDIKNVVNGVDILKKEIVSTALDKKDNILKTPFFDKLFFNLYDFKSEGQEQVGQFLCEKFSLALDKKELNDRISVSTYKNIPLKAVYGSSTLSCVRADFTKTFPYPKTTFPSNYKIVKVNFKDDSEINTAGSEKSKTNSGMDSLKDKTNGKKTQLEKPKLRGR